MESAKSIDTILTLDNPNFCIYLICACLLVLKMMGVTLLTIFYRFKYRAFICPEDAKWLKGQIVTHDTVERMRRAHQNDVENIPIFLVAAFAYLWTQPHVGVAWALYLGFTVFRALHTIVYTLIILPQPSRAITWLSGFLITGYMAIHAAIHAFVYLVKRFQNKWRFWLLVLLTLRDLMGLLWLWHIAKENNCQSNADALFPIFDHLVLDILWCRNRKTSIKPFKVKIDEQIKTPLILKEPI